MTVTVTVVRREAPPRAAFSGLVLQSTCTSTWRALLVARLDRPTENNQSVSVRGIQPNHSKELKPLKRVKERLTKRSPAVLLADLLRLPLAFTAAPAAQPRARVRACGGSACAAPSLASLSARSLPSTPACALTCWICSCRHLCRARRSSLLAHLTSSTFFLGRCVASSMRRAYSELSLYTV